MLSRRSILAYEGPIHPKLRYAYFLHTDPVFRAGPHTKSATFAGLALNPGGARKVRFELSFPKPQSESAAIMRLLSRKNLSARENLAAMASYLDVNCPNLLRGEDLIAMFLTGAYRFLVDIIGTQNRKILI